MATKTANAANPAATVQTGDNNTTEEQNENVLVDLAQSGHQSHINIIKGLVAGGAKRINSVRIKNVNFKEEDNYTRLSFTLTTPIRGYITDDEGASYRLGYTSTMYTSLYAVTGALKEDENLAFLANMLLTKPEAANVILNGATVDILQQEIKTGEEYTNPFTTKDNAEVVTYDHDIFINSIISFKLGKMGEAMMYRAAEKMMGF